LGRLAGKNATKERKKKDCNEKPQAAERTHAQIIRLSAYTRMDKKKPHLHKILSTPSSDLKKYLKRRS
jgi:hypothetical protein